MGNTLMGGGTLRITGDATIGGNLDADTATAVTIRNSGLLNQNGAVTLNGTLINDASRNWVFTGSARSTMPARWCRTTAR